MFTYKLMIIIILPSVYFSGIRKQAIIIIRIIISNLNTLLPDLRSGDLMAPPVKNSSQVFFNFSSIYL